MLDMRVIFVDILPGRTLVADQRLVRSYPVRIEGDPRCLAIVTTSARDDAGFAMQVAAYSRRDQVVR